MSPMNRGQARRLATVRFLARNGEAARRRKNARLSLGEVASVVGVDPVTILRWERGDRTMRAGRPALRYLALLEDLA